MRVQVNLKLDPAAIDATTTGTDGPVFRAVQRAAGRVRDYAKDELGGDGRVRTGLLRNSVESETGVRGKKVVGRIGTNVPYARFVQEGTKSPIVPRRARVLRFQAKGGAYVFAPKVKGTKETGNYTPFLTKALKRLTPNDFL